MSIWKEVRGLGGNSDALAWMPTCFTHVLTFYYYAALKRTYAGTCRTRFGISCA
jgi:hypothetical protein